LSRLELIKHMQVKGANMTSENKSVSLENNCWFNSAISACAHGLTPQETIRPNVFVAVRFALMCFQRKEWKREKKKEKWNGHKKRREKQSGSSTMWFLQRKGQSVITEG